MIEQTDIRWRVWRTPLGEDKEPGEQTRRLKQWLDERGIKAVLFDLDDTLLDTSTFVLAQRDLYVDYLHNVLPAISRAELMEKVYAADLVAFATHAVSIPRWQALAELVAKQYPTEPSTIFTDGVPILTTIYTAAPEMLPGAEDTIRLFADTKKKLGLVTNANERWTYLKLRTHGLDTIFDHVEVADEYFSKGSENWKRAIEALGVNPNEVLVIGDSVTGDIRAAKEAGVNYTVLLPSPVPGFSTGVVPDGVIQAPSIGKVLEVLLQDSKHEKI